MSLRGPRGEHAFQKKIPGEKMVQKAHKLDAFELFSKNTKANFAKTRVFTSKNSKKPNLQPSAASRFFAHPPPEPSPILNFSARSNANTTSIAGSASRHPPAFDPGKPGAPPPPEPLPHFLIFISSGGTVSDNVCNVHRSSVNSKALPVIRQVSVRENREPLPPPNPSPILL